MRWRLLAASAMLAAATGVASAQHIDKERGFTWAVGVGKAWLTSSCNDCAVRPSDTDLGFQFRAGWKLRNNWVVGAEAFLWSNTKPVPSGDQTVSYSSFDAVVLWYPWRHSEAFLKGGFGFTANKTLLVPNNGNGLYDEFKATPMTGILGAGIDLNLAKSWSATPFIDYHYGMPAKATVDGASSDLKVSTSMLIIGVALTVH